MVKQSTKWSVYAGLYAFLCSIVPLVVLYPVASMVVRLLDVGTGATMFVLVLPVPVIGTIGWWLLVERRKQDTYLVGAIWGLATAVAAAGLWVVAFAAVWGPSMVGAGGILVVFVAAVTLPVGLVLGLPFIYARRSFSADKVSNPKVGGRLKNE